MKRLKCHKTKPGHKQKILPLPFTKSLMFILALLFVYGVRLNDCSAQDSLKWKWVHPRPIGNHIRWCKMWDSNNWYLSGNTGLFMKTTDAGANWFITYDAGFTLTLGNNTSDAEAVYFFDMNTGIVAGFWASIVRTTNAGLTFETMTVNGATLSDKWYSIHFVNNQTGYVCGSYMLATGKLAKTTDGGLNWDFDYTVPSSNPFHSVFAINNTILLGNNTGGVIRSTNSGLNWFAAPINVGTTGDLLKFAFFNNDTGFVCGSNTTVSMTTNGGSNWTLINSGLPSSTFYDIDLLNTGQGISILLTGNPNYIFKSTNLGASWDSVAFIGSNQTMTTTYWTSSFISPDTFITGGLYGILNKKFGNSIELITQIQKIAAAINDVWADSTGTNVWTVGGPSEIGNDHVLYSSNGGILWKTQPINSSLALQSICMLNVMTGFAAGNSGTVIKTTNGGTNWTQINTPGTFNLEKIDFVDPNTGWVFGASGIIYKTTDGGSRWDQQNAVGVTSTIYGAEMLDANTGWLVGSNAKVSKTTDGGDNWEIQNANINSNFSIQDIKMFNQNTGYLCGSGGSIRKTLNSGVKWDTILTPLGIGYTFESIDFTDINNIFAGGTPKATVKTTNGGLSWQIDRTPSIAHALCMFTNNSAYLVSGNDFYPYIYKYSQTPIGIIEWHNSVPTGFKLYQNYPNPFNPSTKIKFEIPENSNVTLKIYDISGREVKTIIDRLELNRGIITYDFDGSGLASGIYFYTLVADDRLIDSKKMILLK